jgi:glycine cleavage system regulatory protein
MRTHLVVTITCPDHPGIVERVTEVIERYSANWEESQMARLGGDFAGIVRVSVAAEKAEALAAALWALDEERMSVVVKFAGAAESPAVPAQSLYELRLTGADHEGIVHTVSRYLSDQGINVEKMETAVVPAPMSAAPLFHMEAQIRTPGELPLSELDANLQRIAEDLGVDIELSPSRV